MSNIEATEARVLSQLVVPPSRHLPAIVWRSTVKARPTAAWTPRRLHLVSTSADFRSVRSDRSERQRRKRLELRLRVVESAYLAAALGTAAVIWWSAR